ncbi:MAG: ATP-dependent metallopeptidase FtsH/Yme1/Tma family protein [Clostridiales bacterium]|nr:ATP-dependent metallopeptidase FtsH/Yme1/Tma family protein [Clostridiales bacterium]
MKKFLKGPGFIVILVALVLILSLSVSGSSNNNKPLTYTELLEMIKNDEVASIATVDGTVVVYGVKTDSKFLDRFPDKYDFIASIPSVDIFYEDVIKITAEKKGVSTEQISSSDFSFKLKPLEPASYPWWVALIPYVLLIVVVIISMSFIKRQMGDAGGNAKAMNFSKSRAIRYDGAHKKVTFADVAGAEEEKQELIEIVEFLKDRSKFEALGARIPKGVLLVGPPGTGKTYIAKAVAGEAGVPFLSISGSDFVEMFVGVGASRVRDLFQQAKKLLPCIIFIDEIDAVGRQRGTGLGGGHDEREQTLNQLLVEMDGFTVNSGLIVIAATNRADILDPALTRPGRFDRTVYVGTPDVGAREKIFRIHSKNKPLADEIDLGVLARMTPGFTPADIENIMNEAAILAARNNKKSIAMVEITEAIKRVEIGPEKKSHKVTENDRRLTAFHEAGHAVVSKFSPKADPVNEISIVPRGRAGGYTLQLPTDDKSYITRSELEDRIRVAMGGRIAEDIIFHDISTGASNDIVQATRIAKAMVTEYGMNSSLGPISYSDNNHEIFIGRSLGTQKSYSEATAADIDNEVKLIINKCYAEATKILTDNLDKLNQVANMLLENEKLSGEDFDNIFKEAPEVVENDETVEVDPTAEE